MTMTLPTYNPKYREMPTYTAPKWNEGAIDTLTQKRAAPGLRAMRQQVSRASGVSYDNPNMKRMTLRDALQGYGQGVEQTLSGANAAATNEYGHRFSAESTGAQAEFSSRANATNAYNQMEADRAGQNFGAGMAQWQMDTQNKYAQSAREYLTQAQKDLMKYQMEAQSKYQKDIMAYGKSLQGDDEWKQKMEYQYQLQKQAAEDAQMRAGRQRASSDYYAQWRKSQGW
jgi:hypothetical protein